MEAAGISKAAAPKPILSAAASLSRGLVIGPQPAASAPKPFPSASPKATAKPTTSAPTAAPPKAAPSKPSGPAPRNDNSPRNQQNRRRQRQPNQNNEGEQGKEDPLRILVTGYPTYTQPQDLSRVFCKFGTVRVDKITNKFATLSFLAEDHAQAAVKTSRKVNVYGEFLTVKPFTDGRAAELASKQVTPKREFPRSKQKSQILDPKQLDLSGDFHQQLERVLAAVRLTQEDVSALSVLYSDVETALLPLWPGCSAIPFGSITTGLGVKSSDADCYIHVPPQFRHPHANFVNKAKRILQQYPEVFAEILAIPRANTPIVKFFHIPTATNCDLTFKTPLGAQNSKLVAFLLHADPRLIPMAVIIKYWAKVHDFSGTGKLTNYALTLLMIFYLQQPPMSILPSVEWLQRDGTNDVIVDFWNTGFMSRPESLPKSSNTSSISELIGGFFEYYSMFNFDEMVVCPYIGTPIKKIAFEDLNQLPNEFARYKNNIVTNITMPMRSNTHMCVQDPLEQSHNVASSVSGKLSAEIKAYFKFAANAYEKEKLANCEHFFETLLLQKPKIIRAKSHPEYRVNLFPRIIVTIIDPDWKPIVRDIVFKIFEKMLKIKLGKVEEKVNMDTQKEKEKYMGHLTKAIWRRKQFSRLPGVQALDFAEKQARISEEILKLDKQVLSVQFQLTLTFCHSPRSAVVAVKLGAGDMPAFRDFGKFFISVMQGWFLSLLRPFARPPERDTAAKIADTIDMLDSYGQDADTDDDDDDVLATISANATGLEESGSISSAEEVLAADPIAPSVAEAENIYDDIPPPLPRCENLPPKLREKISKKRKLRRLWQRSRCPTLKRDINKLSAKIREDILNWQLKDMVKVYHRPTGDPEVLQLNQQMEGLGGSGSSTADDEALSETCIVEAKPSPYRRRDDLPQSMKTKLYKQRKLRRLWNQTQCPNIKRELRALKTELQQDFLIRKRAKEEVQLTIEVPELIQLNQQLEGLHCGSTEATPSAAPAPGPECY